VISGSQLLGTIPVTETLAIEMGSWLNCCHAAGSAEAFGRSRDFCLPLLAIITERWGLNAKLGGSDRCLIGTLVRETIGPNIPEVSAKHILCYRIQEKPLDYAEG